MGRLKKIAPNREKKTFIQRGKSITRPVKSMNLLQKRPSRKASTVPPSAEGIIEDGPTDRPDALHLFLGLVIEVQRKGAA